MTVLFGSMLSSGDELLKWGKKQSQLEKGFKLSKLLLFRFTLYIASLQIKNLKKGSDKNGGTV